MTRDAEAMTTVGLWLAILLGLGLVLMDAEREADALRASLSTCEERQAYGTTPYAPQAVRVGR